MEELRGRRVVLRSVSVGDRPLLRHWIRNRELRKHFGRRPSFLAGAQTASSPRDLQFLILLQEGNRAIGLCGLFGISDDGTAEVGIVLGERDTWGQGYGPEALRLLVGHASRDLGLSQISLCVQATNTRAIRAYEKVGFAVEQRLTLGKWLFGRGVEVLVMTLPAPTGSEPRAKEAQGCSVPRG